MFVHYFQAHITFYSLHHTVISESVADVQWGYDYISTGEEQTIGEVVTSC